MLFLYLILGGGLLAGGIKGITIAIGGDTTSLDKALSDVNKKTRNVQNELKKVDKALKLDPQNTQLVTQKQELLGEAIATTKTKLDALRQAQEKVNKAHEANTEWEKQYASLRQEIEETEKKMKTLANKEKEMREQLESGKISEEKYTEYKNALKEVEEEHKTLKQSERDLEAQFENGHISDKEYREYQRTVVETESKLKSLQNELAETSNAFLGLSNKLDKAGNIVSDIGTKTSSIGTVITASVTAPIIAGSTMAVGAMDEVDEGLDTVMTKTGATGQAAKDLQAVYNDVARTIPADFGDIGAAVGEINTRLDFTGDKLRTASEDFLKFAKVNGTDVNQSVQLVTRAMGDAGIPADEYRTLLDALTVAGQKSGISIDTLTTNLAKYGAPMRALGIDTQTSIAMFAGWEKAGVNTEIAFSGMKKAISTWGAEGKDARVEFQKTLDEIKSAPDIASATSMAIEVFGQKAGPDLADAIQNGRFEFDEYITALEQSAGTVESTYGMIVDEVDDTQLAMQTVKVAAHDFGEEIAKTAGPEAKKLADKVKSLGDRFSKLTTQQKQSTLKTVAFVAAVGPGVKMVGSLEKGLGSAMKTGSKFIKTVGKVSAATSNLTGATKAAHTAQGLLSAAWKANPAGVAMTGVAALGAAIAAVTVAIKKSHEAAVNANIKKHWGDVKLSAEEVEDVAKRLTTTDWTMKVDAVIDAREKLADFETEIESAIETINKTEWKVSVGLELTEDEKESYKQAIASYISGVQSYIEQHQFTTTLAINTILMNGTSAKANAEKTAEEYYGGLNETLTQLGNELAELVNTAFEDGILSEDEIAKIDEKKAEIQKKLDEISEAEYDLQLRKIRVDAQKGGLSKESFTELVKESGDALDERIKKIEESAQQLKVPLQVKLNKGDLSPEEIANIEAEMQNYDLQAQRQIGNLVLDNLEFEVGTITSNYGDELNQWKSDTTKTLNDTLTATAKNVNKNNFWDLFKADFKQSYHQSQTDNATKEVIQDCLDAMKPTTESLEAVAQSYYDAGKIPPKEITDALLEVRQLEAMTGNTDHLWELLANQIATSPEYQNTIKAAIDNGNQIPEELANTLKNNYGLVYDTTSGLWQTSTDAASATVAAAETTNNQTGQTSVQDWVDGMNSVDTATPAADKASEAVDATDKTFSDAQLDFLGSSYGNKVPTGFAAGIGGAIGLVTAQVGTIDDKVNTLSSFDSYTWGSHLAQGFANGISDNVKLIGNAALAGAEAAKSVLHFTRPDKGPLRDYEEWPVHFVSRYAELMKSQKPKLSNAALSLADSISAAMDADTAAKYQAMIDDIQHPKLVFPAPETSSPTPAQQSVDNQSMQISGTLRATIVMPDGRVLAEATAPYNNIELNKMLEAGRRYR